MPNQYENSALRYDSPKCSNCTRPRDDPARKLCAACREHSTRYYREKRAERLARIAAAGPDKPKPCIRCGMPFFGARVRCPECLRKIRVVRNKDLDAKPVEPGFCADCNKPCERLRCFPCAYKVGRERKKSV